MIKLASFVLCALFAASPCAAGSLGAVSPDQWMPHATVGLLERVTLRVHWYDNAAALRKAALEHNIGPFDLHGFSVLSRNADTGEYFCDVFVPRVKGASVDGQRTVTFGHEALHCFGFRHD